MKRIEASDPINMIKRLEFHFNSPTTRAAAYVMIDAIINSLNTFIFLFYFLLFFCTVIENSFFFLFKKKLAVNKLRAMLKEMILKKKYERNELDTHIKIRNVKIVQKCRNEYTHTKKE